VGAVSATRGVWKPAACRVVPRVKINLHFKLIFMQDSGVKWATIPMSQVRVKKRSNVTQKGLINFYSKNKLSDVGLLSPPLAD
jgi:hypothetical protein